MSHDPLLRVLNGGRYAVGGTSLVAPRLAGRVFGIDPEDNPAAPFIGRLFGVRAVLMAWLLSCSHGQERQRQLRAGVVVDVTDALAAVVAARTGQLAPRAATSAFAAAILEASIGLRLLRRDFDLTGDIGRSQR